MRTLIAIFLVAINPYWASASAEKIYKCNNTYQGLPCDGEELSVSDERTDAQRRQAQRNTRQQDKVGRRLERERLRAEDVAAQAQRTSAAPIRAATASKAGEAQPKRKAKRQGLKPAEARSAEEKPFTALAPVQAKAREEEKQKKK